MERSLPGYEVSGELRAESTKKTESDGLFTIVDVANQKSPSGDSVPCGCGGAQLKKKGSAKQADLATVRVVSAQSADSRLANGRIAVFDGR